MGRGQTDFGMYAVKEVSASISDMGEVAARLGSINIYDKRGDVVEFDNFEEPVLRWLKTGTGAPTLKFSDLSVRSGSQALYLKTDEVDGHYAGIERGVSILASKRLGNEISYSRLKAGSLVDPLADFYFFMTYYDGVTEHLAQARIDGTSLGAALYVYNAAEVYEKVADLVDLQVEYFAFHTLKLVADFETDKYVRVLLANIEYDISDIALWTDPNDTAPKVVIDIWIENRSNNFGEVWIDDHILTQAEP